ncbi:hypothetical protein VTJ04DRAFT_234 [Mycothermus thermophilus]|uniref:uncharacterized protein n=1 Tax=Humicola insolens TaxID=85995 RepID=UPI003742235E
MGILGKETRPAPAPSSTGSGPPNLTRRYLLGLSFGVSSTVLLHLLAENIEGQLAKGRAAPFDLIVVHVDPHCPGDTQEDAVGKADEVLETYRKKYPRFNFHRIPLSQPIPENPSSSGGGNPLQTAASQSDILTHLIRQTLLAFARKHSCQALLLGHSTTALAELTLAEAAKGRGFALPWLIADGLAPAPPPDFARQQAQEKEEKEKEKSLLIHHPLREALRKELVTFFTLISDLAELSRPPNPIIDINGSTTATTVVSHRDMTIEGVMKRYFADVEENYPSIVANVARTAGRLVRRGGGLETAADGSEKNGGSGVAACEVCGMPRDEDGDERWRGELGIRDDEGDGGRWKGRLCYGCERSVGE